MATVEPNVKETSKRKWEEFVTAAIDEFLASYLSSPAAINSFADEPTGRGFLSPTAREKTRDPEFDLATLTDDDYVGFVDDAQYSQIKSKINSQYSGIGTQNAQNVFEAVLALTTDFKTFGALIQGMAEDSIENYLPLHTQSLCWPDNDSGVLTIHDVELVLSMMYTSNSFRGAQATKDPRQKYTFTHGPAVARSGLYCAGRPEGSESSGMFGISTSWRLRPLTMADFAAGSYALVVGDLAPRAAGAIMTDIEKDTWMRPSDSEWRAVALTIASHMLSPSRARGVSREPFFSKFIARVARNFPEKMQRRVYPLIDAVLTDVESADRVERRIQSPITGRPQTKGALTDKDSSQVADFGNFLEPFDLQCFLLENINYLSSVKDASAPYTHMGRISPSSQHGQPGNLLSYLNMGGEGAAPYVKSLLELCPDVYAMLVPHIKLYRVDYKGKSLTPYKETEIPFGNYVDPGDISLMTKGNIGRLPGAGLKSFSWSLDGVNPADVDNNITAQLVLHFQTVQDIFALNKDKKGIYRGGIPDQAGYLDLIMSSETSFIETPLSPEAPLPTGPVICDIEAERYEGEQFRVKIVAGWSVADTINIDSFPEMNQKIDIPGIGILTKGSILQTALSELKTALYLQVTTHELAFEQDGSVQLTINYQASLTGILTAPSADVFAGDTIHAAKLKELKEEGDHLRTAVNREMEAQNVALEEGGEQPLSEQSANAQNLEANLEEMVEIEEKDKMFKYKRFLCGLYESGKIYGLTLDAATYRQGLLKGMTPYERAQVAKTRSSGDAAVRGFGDPQKTADFDTSMLITMGQVAAQKGTEEHGEMSKLIDESDPDATGRFRLTEDRLEALSDIAMSAVLEGYDDGSVVIPYFYLGDLIENTLERLSHLSVPEGRTNHGAMQLLLGSVELIDPLLAMQIKNVEINCENPQTKNLIRSINKVDPMRFAGATMNNLMFTMNIGSLPVSLNYFQQWFMQNIISPQLEKYSLLSFLKSLCSNLIVRCFNSLCFEKTLNYSLKFDMASFDFQSSYVNRDVDATELAMDIATSRGYKTGQQRAGQDPMCPTMIFYSVDSRPLTGDYEKDFQNGIYHYYLGSACGLTKKIKFNRIDMPNYREARITRKGALGAEQMRELYSVQMDMVGNTLHKNGQYIFVEPIGVGIGSVKAVGNVPNLARMLGLGGYHLVTSVKHQISDEGFNVMVKANQEGLDFSQNKIIAVNTYSGETLQRPNYRRPA